MIAAWQLAKRMRLWEEEARAAQGAGFLKLACERAEALDEAWRGPRPLGLGFFLQRQGLVEAQGSHHKLPAWRLCLKERTRIEEQLQRHQVLGHPDETQVAELLQAWTRTLDTMPAAANAVVEQTRRWVDARQGARVALRSALMQLQGGDPSEVILALRSTGEHESLPERSALETAWAQWRQRLDAFQQAKDEASAWVAQGRFAKAWAHVRPKLMPGASEADRAWVASLVQGQAMARQAAPLWEAVSQGDEALAQRLALALAEGQALGDWQARWGLSRLRERGLAARKELQLPEGGQGPITQGLRLWLWWQSESVASPPELSLVPEWAGDLEAELAFRRWQSGHKVDELVARGAWAEAREALKALALLRPELKLEGLDEESLAPQLLKEAWAAAEDPASRAKAAMEALDAGPSPPALRLAALACARASRLDESWRASAVILWANWIHNLKQDKALPELGDLGISEAQAKLVAMAEASLLAWEAGMPDGSPPSVWRQLWNRERLVSQLEGDFPWPVRGGLQCLPGLAHRWSLPLSPWVAGGVAQRDWHAAYEEPKWSLLWSAAVLGQATLAKADAGLQGSGPVRSWILGRVAHVAVLEALAQGDWPAAINESEVAQKHVWTTATALGEVADEAWRRALQRFDLDDALDADRARAKAERWYAKTKRSAAAEAHVSAETRMWQLRLEDNQEKWERQAESALMALLHLHQAPMAENLLAAVQKGMALRSIGSLMNKGQWKQAYEEARTTRHQEVKERVSTVFVEVALDAGKLGNHQDVIQFSEWAYDLTPYGLAAELRRQLQR